MIGLPTSRTTKRPEATCAGCGVAATSPASAALGRPLGSAEVIPMSRAVQTPFLGVAPASEPSPPAGAAGEPQSMASAGGGAAKTRGRFGETPTDTTALTRLGRPRRGVWGAVALAKRATGGAAGHTGRRRDNNSAVATTVRCVDRGEGRCNQRSRPLWSHTAPSNLRATARLATSKRLRSVLPERRRQLLQVDSSMGNARPALTPGRLCTLHPATWLTTAAQTYGTLHPLLGLGNNRRTTGGSGGGVGNEATAPHSASPPVTRAAKCFRSACSLRQSGLQAFPGIS